MRLRVLALVAVVAASLGWIATRSLPGSVVYFVTPTELLDRAGRAVGERARLGGLTVPGSVRPEGGAVRFVVTDGTTRVTVEHRGEAPALFRSGIGVVLEGTLGADGVFRSDTLLVKHSEEYRPPRPGEAPGVAELRP